MNQKQEAVRISTSAYPFEMPEWQMEILVNHGSNAGFTASIKASDPESMEEAMRMLAECLENNALAMDLSNNSYYWRCSETVAGIYIRSNIHES